MEQTTQAFFAHLCLLREAAWDEDDENHEHAKSLLLALYEEMLERNKILVFQDGETIH